MVYYVFFLVLSLFIKEKKDTFDYLMIFLFFVIGIFILLKGIYTIEKIIDLNKYAIEKQKQNSWSYIDNVGKFNTIVVHKNIDGGYSTQEGFVVMVDVGVGRNEVYETCLSRKTYLDKEVEYNDCKKIFKINIFEK
ncbi:hypothetical protein LDC_2891 [sediment metagenome]|uniref:Uncharacterized protein n=1 Tax=sediment metagenome TaxID=749907 RepID=D9PMW2_9ZZZZ